MISGELKVVSIGEKFEIEWKLNFYVLQENYAYYSPDFVFEGEIWNLTIHTNGRDSKGQTGIIELSLRREARDPPISLEFSFALKTVNGQRYKAKEQTGVFTKQNFYFIQKYMNRTEVLQNKSKFRISGSFIIICTIKKLTHTEGEGVKATAECLYCKKSFAKEELSSHQKKCRVKCPECSNFVVYHCWNDHKCQVSRVEAASNTCESFMVSNGNKLLQDLKQLLLNKEHSDIVLSVKGVEFPAHKAILTARSPVFASTFRNEMKEKKTGTVEIQDCDPSVFSHFLSFLYSNDTDHLSEENVFGLFKIADKYDCPDLKEKCIHFIKESLSIETFCEALTLALLHNEAELLHVATDFFVKNAEKILVTVDWQTFAAENPTQSNELVIKLVASCRS